MKGEFLMVMESFIIIIPEGQVRLPPGHAVHVY